MATKRVTKGTKTGGAKRGTKKAAPQPSPELLDCVQKCHKAFMTCLGHGGSFSQCLRDYRSCLLRCADQAG
jgi:hypothetical protein